MNRAARGPTEQIDADQVWKKGNRRRMVRRSAVAAAAVLVAVVLVGGVVVVSGNSQRDADLAGLEGDERTAVETYLNSLEEQGALEVFPDSRAAVEYAQRNDCFAGVDLSTAIALAEAIDELAAALEAEAYASAVSSATGEPVAAELLSRTDAAIETYEVAIDGLGVDSGSEEALQFAVEATSTRLGDLETLRTGVSTQQLSGFNAGKAYLETASRAIEILDAVTRGMDDAESAQAVGDVVDLLMARHERATAWAVLGWVIAGPGPGQFDVGGGEFEFEAYMSALQAEDDRKVRFEDFASPEEKSLLRNALSSEGVRDAEARLTEGLVAGSEGVPVDMVLSSGLEEDRQADASAYSAIVDSLIRDLPGVAPTAYGVEVDEAVGIACEAAGPVLVTVDPPQVG